MTAASGGSNWMFARLREMATTSGLSSMGGMSLAVAGSAGLALAVVPWLSHYIAPVEYATFALVTSVGSALAIVLAGRFEVAVLLVPGGSLGHYRLKATVVLALAAGAVVAVAVQALSLVVVYLVSPGLSASWTWLLVVPFTAWVTLAATIQNLVDSREGSFGAIRAVIWLRAGLLALGQVIAAFADPTWVGLSIAYLVSTSPSLIRLGWRIAPGRLPAWPYLGALARRYARFPAYEMWGALAQGSVAAVLLFSINLAYGPATMGLLALALRIAMVPSSVIASPMNSVFIRRFRSVGVSSPEGAVLARHMTLLGVGLGVICGLGVAIVGLPVSRLLGAEWTGTLPFIWACVPLVVALLVIPVPNSVLTMRGAQVELTWWRLLGVVLLASTVAGLGSLGVAVVPVVVAACTVFLAVALLLARRTLVLASRPGLGSGS